MSLHACSTSRLTAMDTAVTRVVVFAMGPAARAPKPVWSCGGASLACVSEYKCLGVMFPAEQGLAAGFLHLRGRLHDTGVLWQRQFAELGDGLSLELMRQLDLQAVPPAGSHACEVWGVRICQAAQNKPVPLEHGLVLRGLADRTPAAVVPPASAAAQRLPSHCAAGVAGVVAVAHLAAQRVPVLECIGAGLHVCQWRAVALSDSNHAIDLNDVKKLGLVPVHVPD